MNTRIVHSISSVLRTDGFVRNIHAANPFDVIRADVVLARIEKAGALLRDALRAVSGARAGRCAGLSGCAAAEKTARRSWARRQNAVTS